MKFSQFSFGKFADGREVTAYRLENRSGMSVTVLNYGARIQSLAVKAPDGSVTDVALGFDSAAAYGGPNGGVQGACIGRWANRIKSASFQLGQLHYHLNANEGNNHLHGGIEGFSKKFWNCVPSDSGLTFWYVSPHMEEGYPGTLHATVRYRLTADNALEITYLARSDRDTVFNPTNHTYFNLAGGHGDVLDYTLQLAARRYTDVDDELIPTGETPAVEGTPFDFTRPATLRGALGTHHLLTRQADGYDINFVLEQRPPESPAAVLSCPSNGLRMSCFTDRPCLQLYTANGMADAPGKNGCRFGSHCAVCLETQYWPDAMNQPAFPSGILKAGEVFRSTTAYRFDFI